jgi:chromosome segregation ATPase
MSEMNKELVSLGKIEEAKMLTQEEIDNRIINKIEDIKYGYLELGGYLKISKEIYFRDTIDIYNKLKGTNIKYEEVERMAQYTRETNRDFDAYSRNTYGLSTTAIYGLINVCTNYTKERIETMPKSARGYGILNRLLSTEDEYFKIEDFLNLNHKENALNPCKKNKDLNYRELDKAIVNYNKLKKEYNELEKEADKEGISIKDVMEKEQKALSNKLYNELRSLRNFKEKFEVEKEEILNEEISKAVERYEQREQSLAQETDRLKAQYGNIEEAKRKLEAKEEELYAMENDYLEKLRSLPKTEDVKKERNELLSEKTKLSNEIANLSNEITMLNNRKLETTKTIEKLEDDLKDLAPFRDKMRYLYNNINLIIDIKGRLDEILSQDYTEYLKYEDVKDIYLTTLDTLVESISNVYEKLGESERIISFNNSNIIEQ